jgi:hypothetical protein
VSANLYYHLTCDHLGCAATLCANVDRADATRAHASGIGWVHGVVPPAPRTGGPAKSLDYCTAHAGELGDLKPKTLPPHAGEISGPAARIRNLKRALHEALNWWSADAPDDDPNRDRLRVIADMEDA